MCCVTPNRREPHVADSPPRQPAALEPPRARSRSRARVSPARARRRSRRGRHEPRSRASARLAGDSATTERRRSRRATSTSSSGSTSLVDDVRYAARTLRNAPAFALVAILSLALGIGANTAIFSLINAVMLRSLPVNHPEQLVQLVMADSNAHVHQSDLGTDPRSPNRLRRRVRVQRAARTTWRRVARFGPRR